MGLIALSLTMFQYANSSRPQQALARGVLAESLSICIDTTHPSTFALPCASRRIKSRLLIVRRGFELPFDACPLSRLDSMIGKLRLHTVLLTTAFACAILIPASTTATAWLAPQSPRNLFIHKASTTRPTIATIWLCGCRGLPIQL